MRMHGAALAAVAVLLGGCGTMQPLVSAAGPGKGAEGKAIAFETTAAQAQSDPAQTRAMLQRGYELIQANCDDYFRSAGEAQFNVNFLRDASVATATIVTSGMLYNPRNQRAVGLIPLVGGAVYTGMDVYNKNFLFSAENIDSVKTLVMKAVTTHQALTLERLGEAQPTYGEALVMLQENQAYCMPAKIVPLVRTAIKKGEIGEVSQSAPVIEDKRTPQEVAGDDAVLKALGAELNPPGVLSLQQATALYWLFKSDTTTEERVALYEKLASLKTASQPLQSNGDFIAAWAPHQRTVEDELGKLSAPTVGKMKAAIAEFRGVLEERRLANARSKDPGFTALAAPEQASVLSQANRRLPALNAASSTVLRGRRPLEVDVQ